MLKKIEQAVTALAADAVELLKLTDNLGILENSSSTEPDRRFQFSRQINENYRLWYSIAWPLVIANLPERVGEFEKMYESATYEAKRLVSEYGKVQGREVSLFAEYFSVQVGFIRSIPRNIESKALALRGLLARDLMEDELSVARHLLESGYIREAGVIAGVVLERHLKLLCEKYGVEVNERDTLGQLNEKLKSHYPSAVEHRRVQFLNEIRVSCAHDKAVEPDPNAVSQLISGVQGFITTIG